MKKILLLTSLLTAAISAQATLVNLSGANGEQTLQQIVNGTSINIATDQLTNDSYFTAGSVSAKMVIEIAGYAPNNAFGIYQMGSPANKIEIFAGSASAGAASGTFLLPVGWSSFGFYLANLTQNFVWYSDAALNADGGLDHFVTYKGPNGQTMTASGITFGASDYLIGIEDLNLGDYDYNDMVVKVHVNMVPDGGASVALLGLGLVAVTAFRRRK